MIDLGISKLALIGVVALVVIGPEKLPRVARTVGALIGKAQRYVADVKAEVNRSMDLEELRKMKDSVETAARDVGTSIQTSTGEFERSWAEATGSLEGSGTSTSYDSSPVQEPDGAALSVYQAPRKNWRLKRSAVPQWYKARAGTRTRALSGAARVARFRPRRATD